LINRPLQGNSTNKLREYTRGQIGFEGKSFFVKDLKQYFSISKEGPAEEKKARENFEYERTENAFLESKLIMKPSNVDFTIQLSFESTIGISRKRILKKLLHKDRISKKNHVSN